MKHVNLLLILLAAVSCKHPQMTAPDKSIYQPRKAEMRAPIYNRETEFDKMDKDADGFLSPTEYNGSEKLFAEMDLDASGTLSKTETKNMITFAEIPTGTFMMGSAVPLRAFFEPATDCTPLHEVQLDAFKMSATEVTNAQYVMYLNSALAAGEIEVVESTVSNNQTRLHYPVAAYAVFGAKGTKFEGKPYIHLSPVAPLSHHKMTNGLLLPEHPLNISWVNYIPELNVFEVHDGFEDWPACHIKWWGAMAFAEYYGLSLPTEAEWEYTAKGGKDYQFPTYDGKNDGQRSNYACYNVLGVPSSKFNGADNPEDFIGFRITVGTYPPNPYGVYDMAGNVWEWCYDWYDENYYQHCIDNKIKSNPLNLDGEDSEYISLEEGITGGPGQVFSHDARVCRGGSWNYHEMVTRSEFRFPVYSFIGNDHFGFRVVSRGNGTEFNGTN
jgi:formylglycine-generating enzyme required for sulfatase activity